MTDGTDSDVKRAVRRALDEVLDPCSCMTDDPVSIVELGIVDGVDITDGLVRVRLVPTSPMCLYVADIKHDIHSRLEGIPGVTAVEVVQDTDVIWTPDRVEVDTAGSVVSQADRAVDFGRDVDLG